MHRRVKAIFYALQFQNWMVIFTPRQIYLL